MYRFANIFHHTGLIRIYNITIDEQCVSDFKVRWESADFDSACGKISYYVTLTGNRTLVNDESNKEDFNVTEKYMNFTGLNDREYIVTVQSISSEGYGEAVFQHVHTVNSSLAAPSSELKI